MRGYVASRTFGTGKGKPVTGQARDVTVEWIVDTVCQNPECESGSEVKHSAAVAAIDTSRRVSAKPEKTNVFLCVECRRALGGSL